jgi:DNA-directed RNA polymerase
MKPSQTDFDRSLERFADSEEQRKRAAGFGATKQGQALARKYLDPLADKIAADRAQPRDRAVWQVLKDFDNETLAHSLLINGISVAEKYSALGTDEDGLKNFRDQALWLGSNFGQRREAGLGVGNWCFNMLEGLPIFALDGNDVLRMTETADAIMDEVVERGVRANPLLSPPTTVPVDWSQVSTGGLPTDHWADVPLIREHGRAIEAAARKAIGTGQMKLVLDAINSLQRVPFAINEHILGLISRYDAPNVDAITAEVLAYSGRFWLVHNMDFRGRVYAVSHFNFQREDKIRALFLFADGVPIGEGGPDYLKAHVAKLADGNGFSRDKRPGELGFEGRIAWSDDEYNKTVIRRVGEAVLRGDDPATIKWALPKDRWQFMAACAEFVQALDEGPTFKTRLPLTFDGSCSGLQHMCAMTRAEEGRFVNLMPAEDGEGDDIYKRVAFRVSLIVPTLCDPDDRRLVKQPVMSFFYGSTPWGMAKQIRGAIKKRNKDSRYPFVDAYVDAYAYDLAKAVVKAIEDMVPKAKALRDGLVKLARLLAKNGEYLRWTTHLRMPVLNAYHEPITKEVSLSLRGRRRRVKLVVGDKKEVWVDEAGNASPANFVHSFDAAHLQLVALAAKKEHIDLVVVHDCFGCLAPHARRMNEIIRDQFVQLYESPRAITDVWTYARKKLGKNVKLPSQPEIGSLDIEQVVDSFHAWK